MRDFPHMPASGVSQKTRAGTLLLVDDEPDNLDLLEGLLARSNYNTLRAENGHLALAMLRANPDQFDAVLLDRMMPEMDGLAVLVHMKADSRLKTIPVILQTAAGNTMQVSEGLAAGAHYYLIKPFDRRQLLPIVDGAVANYKLLRDMRARLQQSNPFGLIVRGSFRLRTLTEARELSTWLARASADPIPVAFGLKELLTNAVEHGNLGLGYEAKRAALLKGTLEEELAQRAADPLLAQRSVWVDVERNENSILYTIRDEGEGFDCARYVTVDPARMADPNGRGIMMARELSFAELTYQGCANTVCARVAVSAWQGHQD